MTEGDPPCTVLDRWFSVRRAIGDQQIIAGNSTMWPFSRKRMVTSTYKVDFSHEELPSILVSQKEYKSPELETVFSIIKNQGWEPENENWFLAGAQEIIVRTFRKDGQKIFLHLETYVGARLHAPESILAMFEEIRIEEREKSECVQDDKQSEDVDEGR